MICFIFSGQQLEKDSQKHAGVLSWRKKTLFLCILKHFLEAQSSPFYFPMNRCSVTRCLTNTCQMWILSERWGMSPSWANWYSLCWAVLSAVRRNKVTHTGLAQYSSTATHSSFLQIRLFETWAFIRMKIDTELVCFQQSVFLFCFCLFNLYLAYILFSSPKRRANPADNDTWGICPARCHDSHSGGEWASLLISLLVLATLC